MSTTWLQRARPLRVFALPFMAGGLALASALAAAIMAQAGTGIGGLNTFVEGLSGGSASALGAVGLAAPLGFAFAAGMVSAVNPCGFAMLPAYLGLYLGTREEAAEGRHPAQQLLRGVVVGGVVSLAFVLLFGLAGVVIGVGAQFVVDILPWIGLTIGILLVGAGSWLLGGGKVYTDLAARAAGHLGNPNEVGIQGYFLFGLAYGTASLSCTLPIFLTVVGTTLAVSGVAAAVGQFILYGLGMGTVIMMLTLGMAVLKGTMVGALRKALPYVQPVSAALMIVAGAYIVFYWLTIGGLL